MPKPKIPTRAPDFMEDDTVSYWWPEMIAVERREDFGEVLVLVQPLQWSTEEQWLYYKNKKQWLPDGKKATDIYLKWLDTLIF